MVVREKGGLVVAVAQHQSSESNAIPLNALLAEAVTHTNEKDNPKKEVPC